MTIKFINTKLNDCKIIEPTVYSDKRGYFLETYQKKNYSKLFNKEIEFKQDNHSHSVKNVLRGLHFQVKKPQGKLVRVVNGAVFDVIVDIRRNSSTFAKWDGIELSEDNKRQLWIPPGFAHGFLVLSDEVDFEYKCTDYYDADDEACIKWDDPELNIKWPIQSPILSQKDSQGNFFKDIINV